MNYKILKNFSISTAFNTDFTPISKVMSDNDLQFSLISYSVLIGLRIDL